MDTEIIPNIEDYIQQVIDGNLVLRGLRDTNNTRVIPNIKYYTQQVIDGNLVLRKLPIDEVTLFQKDLKGSKILKCKINDNIKNIKYYKDVLLDIYSTTDKETIIQNKILNIVEQKAISGRLYQGDVLDTRPGRTGTGWVYHDNLGLSIQGAESTKLLKQIIKLIKIKNDTIELKIKLKNDEICLFRI